MTREQCALARRLLGLTQRELATAIGAQQVTIGTFERTGHMAAAKYGQRDRLTELRTWFEARGIHFVEENEGGAGVKLQKAGS